MAAAAIPTGLWIGNLSLTAPLTIDEPTKNLVIAGRIASSFDITIKVKNLILIGDIICLGKLNIDLVEDHYFHGNILAMLYVERGSSKAPINESIEKIRALGLTIQRSPTDATTAKIDRTDKFAVFVCKQEDKRSKDHIAKLRDVEVIFDDLNGRVPPSTFQRIVLGEGAAPVDGKAGSA